ncbi:MAG: redox-regulated ATPase YchF [Lachnospiraceae bacterium]|nr:redox-regulated ATPase YchF [Lachnospiraceae bacterium]
MKLGIVGLPNIGKSTLFNALTKADAEAVNYPFSTIKPNIGNVPVPDERLKLLGDLYKSKKITPASIEFVDIAGLAKGASRGEGLGNQFLSHIREVDAIIHVVRCFSDDNIIHVDGDIDPMRDIENLDLELIFADLEILERRIAKTIKAAKADKALAKEVSFLEALKAHMEEGEPARSYVKADENEAALLSGLDLLTKKPIIFAANVDEDDLSFEGAENPHIVKIREHAKATDSEMFVVCAQIEQEIAQLSDDEKEMFLEDLGIAESSLNKLIKTSYRLLGLMSFLTAGEDETRAWTIKIGTKAPQAAGKIHSDLERGFIRAEVVNYRDLLDNGSMAAAKEKGLVGIEGKEYIVKDGDVLLIRFNV